MSVLQYHCISMGNIRVPIPILDHIVTKAGTMFVDRKKKLKVSGDDFEGLITTKFETVLLWSLEGILFKSRIEYGHSSGNFNFMVRPQELELIAHGLSAPHGREIISPPLNERVRARKALEFQERRDSN